MAFHRHVGGIPLRQSPESEMTPALLYQASCLRPRSDTGGMENEQCLGGC